jgi:hypothetical protein
MKAEAQTQLILKRLDDLERGMHHLHREQHALIRGVVGAEPLDGDEPAGTRN